VCRIVRPVVRRQVALRVAAICRLNRQRRVIAHMALVAARDLPGRRNLMRVRQREARVRMIKRRIRPHDCVVALRAQRGREARRNMVRHGPTKRWRAVPGRLVTAVAIRVRSGKRIVVAHVAVRAGIDLAGWRHLVRARQCPARSSMVKRYICPQGRSMAGRAIGRSKGCARCGVRGIVGRLPGCQMASGIPAVVRLNRQIVIVVDMAVRAGIHLPRRRHLVRIRQREACRAVIEVRCQPRNGIVASGAGRNRKHGGRRRMLGVRRLLPGCQMASGIPAVRGRDLQLVVPPNVTACTGNIGVPVGEREIDGRSRMVDGGAQPTVKRVTRLASLRELCRYVIGIGRFLKIRLVAGNTGGRQSLKLADRRTFVAVLTLHGSVST